ncbi:MAG: hypothetical protein Q7V88_13085 [Actinomycetota bacterium]|nr:hypothetical protein [Actinomycetota bacterium]
MREGHRVRSFGSPAEMAGGPPRRRARARRGPAFLAAMGLVGATVLTVLQVAAPTAHAVSSLTTANLQVMSATDATPITTFKYLINIDNTGSTKQREPSDGCSPEAVGYPDSCDWTSMGHASNSPIFTQGTEADFASGGIDLLPGNYLISVLADGYKLDGEHFTIPLGDDEVVTVLMQPAPLPDATVQAAVFEDISPVNGAPDLPAEHGLAGFVAGINDVLGPVTTDVYGAPLCGDGTCESYCYAVDGGIDIGIVTADINGRCPVLSDQLAAGDPTGLYYTTVPYPSSGDFAAVQGNPAFQVPGTAAIEGKVKIPNIGTGRFTMFMTPPNGQAFSQTTTLEGNHDWDAWVMEGNSGLDTEFVIAGEPFPAIIFGFAPPNVNPASGVDGVSAGSITGVVDAVKVYVPANGGLTNGGDIWGGLNGGKIDKPIDQPWVALSDLGNGDTAVWVGRGDSNGEFTIPHVPDGTYLLTWWDDPQDYILDWQQVIVANGEVVDMGVLPLSGWWTQYSGYVFNDANRNGRMDWVDANGDNCPQASEGEVGIANYGIVMRRRDNSLMDRGTNAVSTDNCGYYFMESTYPMTQWLVMEAYTDLYYTTGITYQADNQPEPTTVPGAGVDVSVLPIIGLSGTVDWGVHAYDASGATGGLDPRNGGIVGTVSYDTTRNELDPRFAAVEDWQPGVSGLTVELYAPVECTDALVETCDEAEMYQLHADGSYLRGALLNSGTTETWTKPGADVDGDGIPNDNGDGNCVPRDVDGNELTYPAGQQITASATDCLEAPLMGMQFQKGYSAVDGNYGFGDGCQDPTTAPFDPNTGRCADGSDPADQPLLGGRDYLVHIGVPLDALGRPMYNFTREEDINIGNGDEFVPQVPPPACAGALHIVDVAGVGLDNHPAQTLPNGIVVPASTPTDNSTFIDIGGSPYEGQAKPLCDTKLVGLNNGKSIAPLFNVFTDVPLPGRFWGLLVDDLNFSSDPHQINFGEKSGIAFAPVGIYDYTNRLVYTAESDYSGLFDVLLPSTNRINCPTPSGVCGNTYRFVGNDPGNPGSLNTNYRPEFRTIAAEFEAIPGVVIPADLAPTQVGVTVQLPGGQATRVQCDLPATAPQLFAVSAPYVQSSGSITIEGVGFGAAQGTGSVTLAGTPLGITSWNDTTIVANVSAGIPAGSQQLLITNNAGITTVNGLTFHVLRGAVTPFPATPVLDTFNRATLGGNWQTLLGGGFGITSNQLSGTASTPRAAQWSPTSFGADQEAYVTINKLGPVGSELGVGLKGTYVSVFGFNSPLTGIRVVRTSGSNIQVRTQTLAVNNVANIAAASGLGSTIGARTLADGTVQVFVDGTLVGSVNVVTGAVSGAATLLGGFSPWSAALAGGGGRIQVWSNGLAGGANNGLFDNFGGGNTPAAGPSYQPNLYEVGNGHPFATIQAAVNAATASDGDDIVVVYPGQPDPGNPRLNPRGAYFENLILSSPVKLQGVGPGGTRGNQTVPGSIIDGAAFAGDGTAAVAWYTLLDTLTWSGNQTVNDGAVVSVFAEDGEFTSAFTGSIDGFDLRGGDQQGFPGNLNEIGGGATGLPANVQTQGGAVFANAFARYLQITNNIVENNGGGYGTIRIGTPDLAAGENHNENVRIARNRIIQNGGTNLAGGIGLFAESDNYVVADNDICGNFSAEYGGGLTAIGYSPGGTIEHNRIWFNRSYDEGGGVMIAGDLPNNPDVLSQGSGPVTIRRNLIQSNMANDDGGGLRFLMAGNYPMTVTNNTIVNNVSTHEGGGVALNDTPQVRFFNNTVMKNVTTATAITSNGLPAPAGLSTSPNSAPLQASLPGGSPLFSEPLLFNNVFSDNRAGTRTVNGVAGIGATGDPSPVDVWDLGVSDGSGLLAPTNSVILQVSGAHPYTTSPTNSTAEPLVVAAYNTQVAFNNWRTNPNFIGAILVSLDLPPELLGNYHLVSGSNALNLGAVSKSGVNAPADDIDGNARPQGGGFDAGSDEMAAATAAFPRTSSLDNFNRANSTNLNTGLPSAVWTPALPAGYRVNSNALQVQGGTSSTVPVVRTTRYGGSQEAWFTFTETSNVATRQALVLKASNDNKSMIIVDYSSGQVRVQTIANSQGLLNRGAPVAATFGAGDQLGARALSDGTVTVFKNGVQILTVDVDSGATPWPGSLSRGGGRIGVWFIGTTVAAADDARIDNFGGGTMP